MQGTTLHTGGELLQTKYYYGAVSGLVRGSGVTVTVAV